MDKYSSLQGKKMIKFLPLLFGLKVGEIALFAILELVFIIP